MADNRKTRCPLCAAGERHLACAEPVAVGSLGVSADQKRQLRDCFEGVWDRDFALAACGLADSAVARRLWNRWAREFEETGSYTF